jgi:hypothetical protein
LWQPQGGLEVTTYPFWEGELRDEEKEDDIKMSLVFVCN